MNTNIKCKWSGCLFTSPNSYSLTKHEARCRFREIIHSNSSSPQHHTTQPCTPHVPPFNINVDLDPVYPISTVTPLEQSFHSSDQLPSSEPASSVLINTLAIAFCAFEQKLGARAVDQVIDILRNPDFSLSSFRNSIHSFHDCKTITNQLVRQQISSQNLTKKKIFDSSGMSFGFIFTKNPLTVLQQQCELANSTNCEFQPSRLNNMEQNHISHPLHTQTMYDLCKHKQQSIMSSDQDNVFWNSNPSLGPISFVGCLQIFSDKSKTTLKTKALVAYPVHLTFQNFSISLRREMIAKDLTVIGYLPTNLLPVNDYDEDDDEPVLTSSSTGRKRRLSILHNSLTSILSPLADTAYTGFPCTDSTGKKLTCFPILTNYCCDIPEAKDVAGVVAGVNTLFPCHRCLVPRTELASTTQFPLRSVNEIPNYRTPPNDVSMISLYSQSSFLENSPLAPSLLSFDFYKLFRFEILHNFLLGISKLLKICIIHRLQSNNLFTSAGSTRNQSKTFKSVHLSILRGVNSLLATIEKDYFVPGLTIDFSTSEIGQQLNGLFLEQGLRGMLEGRHFKSLDMVFPIVGAFIDYCCDEIDTSPLTILFAMYSDLLFTCLWKKKWTKLDLDSLDGKISTFKELCIDTFQQHHPSGLRTLKFHLLNHLVNDIAETGGLQHVEAGTYESAHKSFKRHYKQTSMRHDTAFQETLTRMELHNNLTRYSSSLSPHSLSSSHNRKLSPELGAVLVRDGVTLSLLEYQSFILSMSDLPRSNTGALQYSSLNALREFHSEHVFTLYQQLGDQGSSALLKLIAEFLNENNSTSSFAQVQLTIVKSAFLVGGLSPTLQNYNEQTEDVEYNPSYQRYIQRIFATNNFGSNNKPRFSFVALESSKEKCVWFSKLHALFRIKATDLSEPIECAFVRYMDTTKPINNIDSALGCVCLRWSTDDNKDYTVNPTPLNEMGSISPPAPFFGLIHASSIYSSIHVIRRNIPYLPFIPKTHWMYHRFCINRFYSNCGELEYNE